MQNKTESVRQYRRAEFNGQIVIFGNLIEAVDFMSKHDYANLVGTVRPLNETIRQRIEYMLISLDDGVSAVNSIFLDKDGNVTALGEYFFGIYFNTMLCDDRVNSVYRWLCTRAELFDGMDPSAIANTVVSMILQTDELDDSKLEACEEPAKSQPEDPVKKYVGEFLDDTGTITNTHDNIIRCDIERERGIVIEVKVPEHRTINMKALGADEIKLHRVGGVSVVALTYLFSKCDKETKLMHLAHEEYFGIVKRSYAEDVMRWTRSNMGIDPDELVKAFPIFKNNFRFLKDKVATDRFIDVWRFFQCK